MIIYFLLLSFVLLGFCYPKNVKILIFQIMILCILVFFRAKTVGTDVMGYSANYQKMTDNPITWNYYLPFEMGFNYFLLAFKNIVSSNPLYCWGTIGVLYTLSISKFIVRYTKNCALSISLFVLFGTYFLCYNIMRQCFAYSILLFIFSYVNLYTPSNKEKLLLFICIVLCGWLFHPTMLIFMSLFIFYVDRKHVFLQKKILVSLLLVSCFCCITQIIIPTLIYVLELVSVEGKLVNYAVKNIQSGEDSSFSLFKAIMITSFQIYAIIVTKDTKNIFLYMSTFGILFLNIFSPLVVEFARVYELFVVFQIIYLSQLWSSLKTHSLKTNFFKIVLVCYSIILYVNILLKNYGEIVPYEFRL